MPPRRHLRDCEGGGQGRHVGAQEHPPEPRSPFVPGPRGVLRLMRDRSGSGSVAVAVAEPFADGASVIAGISEICDVAIAWETNAGGGFPLARRGGGKRAKPKFGPIYAREPDASRRCSLRVIETQETPALTSDGVGVPSCRFCAGPLRDTFVDLGMSPLCESYVPADRANAEELFYPLHARVCASCLLVQLEEFVTRRAHLQRVRLLLVVLRLLGRARARLRGDGRRAASSSARTVS